jgi:hypothetical protein
MLWLLLKRIPIKTFIHKISIAFVVSGVIDTADHRKRRFQMRLSLLIEAICKEASTRGSGAQMELFDEQNRRPKIS